MSKTLIHNIGTILSGAFENPILAGDTVCTDGDKIVFIGNRADAPALDYTLDIDANGLTLCPGIIDAHAPPPLANYLEAYKAYDWVDNYAGAGITSLVSLGGHNFAGAAGDVVSAKAQAIYSKYYWDHNHPSFAKIHAGTGRLKVNNPNVPQDTEIKFILDMDLSMGGSTPCGLAAAALETLHGHSSRVFEGAITDRLRDAMGR